MVETLNWPSELSQLSAVQYKFNKGIYNIIRIPAYDTIILLMSSLFYHLKLECPRGFRSGSDYT